MDVVNLTKAADIGSIVLAALGLIVSGISIYFVVRRGRRLDKDTQLATRTANIPGTVQASTVQILKTIELGSMQIYGGSKPSRQESSIENVVVPLLIERRQDSRKNVAVGEPQHG